MNKLENYTHKFSSSLRKVSICILICIRNFLISLKFRCFFLHRPWYIVVINRLVDWWRLIGKEGKIKPFLRIMDNDHLIRKTKFFLVLAFISLRFNCLGQNLYSIAMLRTIARIKKNTSCFIRWWIVMMIFHKWKMRFIYLIFPCCEYALKSH